MKLYNGEIDKLVNFLLEEALDRIQTRLRARFINLVKNRVDEFNKEVQDIQYKYAEKDEYGEIKIVDIMITILDQNSFNKEYNEIALEEFVIDELESNRSVLLAIKNIVLNTKREEFKGIKAMEYERWCEIVEQIKYEGMEEYETIS